MIRFVDYRKNCLIRSLDKVNLIEGIDKHFDLLQLNLLDSIRLPHNLNEGYLGETAWILEQVAEEDYLINKSIVIEYVSLLKNNFNQYMLENVDFDSFLNSGGPNGINSLNQTEQLKRKIKWAIDGFKDNVRKLIEPILNNRSGDSQIDSTSAGAGTGGVPFGPTSGGGGSTPPNTAAGGGQSSGTPTGGGGGSSQASSGGGSTASATTGPNAGNSGGPGPTSSATGWTSPMGNSHAPTGSNSVPAGSNVPWWNRKTKHGWWKGIANLTKSARKGIWDRLKAGWRGDNLADSTRAEIVNLVENLFLENSIDILDTIDQWSDKLYDYLSKNIDIYAQSMSSTSTSNGSTTSASSTPPNSSNGTPNPSILTPQRAPGQPMPTSPQPSSGSSQSPLTAPPGQPKKRGGVSLMSDETFENLIRSGQPVMPNVLANKAANAGFHFGDKEGPGVNLLRYNAFRKKYGLEDVNKLPPWETKDLTEDELNGYKTMSEDKLKTIAERKNGGKSILRKLGRAFGLEAPSGLNSRDVAVWKDFASQIYQKLQSGETPKVGPAPISINTNEPLDQEVPSVTQPTKPENHPSVVQPRELPGSTTNQSNTNDDAMMTWADQIAAYQAKAAQDNQSASNPDPSLEPEPLKNDIPEVPADHPGIDLEPQDDNSEGEHSLEDDGFNPSFSPENKTDSGSEDITKRTEDLKSGLAHDLEQFETGTSEDGNPINLPNAKQSMPSDEELSGLIDKLSKEKGGLQNVTEDELLNAAHNLFIDKYSQGKDRDNIIAKMNRIDQDRIKNQGSSASDEEDMHSMFGNMHNEPESEQEPESALDTEGNQDIEEVLKLLPQDFLKNIDATTLDEIKQQIAMNLKADPNVDFGKIAKKVMQYAAQSSKVAEIYNGLKFDLKNELSPVEIKSLIGEMLSTKTLQNVPCPNCENQPGKVENCPNCRGTGQKRQLSTIPESMIPHKLEEAIVKKKMANLVDPLTKEPEYKNFLELWPNEAAAKSDILQQFQKQLKMGIDKENIPEIVKNYMRKTVEKDLERQKSTQNDDNFFNPQMNTNADLDDMADVDKKAMDYQREKEAENPTTLTRERLSNEKIPGTATTYYDYLNQKLRNHLSQDNVVEKEINRALAAVNDDPNGALDLLKQRVQELQQTDNESGQVTKVRNALLSNKVSGNHSYFKFLQSRHGGDTNEANKFIAKALKANNGDIQKTIDAIKKDIETNSADDIQSIKDADNIVSAATSSVKPKVGKKKSKEEDQPCPFCSGSGSVDGEECEDCGGSGKYQEEPDQKQSSDLDDEDDEDRDDDDEHDRFSRNDDEENTNDGDIDLDSILNNKR